MNPYTNYSQQPSNGMEFPGYTITNAIPTAPYTAASLGAYQVQPGSGAQPYSNPCATNYPGLEFPGSGQPMATQNHFAGYQAQSVIPNGYGTQPYYNPLPAPSYPQYPAFQTNYYLQYPTTPQNNLFVPEYAPAMTSVTIHKEITVYAEPEKNPKIEEFKAYDLELQSQLSVYESQVKDIESKITTIEKTVAMTKEANSELEIAIKLSQLHTDLEVAKKDLKECQGRRFNNDIALATYEASLLKL